MTTRLPEAECLRCRKKVDAASCIADDGAAPEPGDVTICIFCGYLMTFADDLSFRELTEEEILELPLDEISRFQIARKRIEESKKNQ